MSNRAEILTPPGRLVRGSLYDGQTTDAENKPLVYKTGVNAGQPRVDFYFAVAIPKETGKQWWESEWGAAIKEVAEKGFPGGQSQHPSFAWKIIDGDSDVPNKAGRKPCEFEGYRGHWVLNFSSGFAPNVYTENGDKQLTEKDAVKPGDWIEVYGFVTDNESQQQPGVYLNHSMINFVGYGERITLGKDPKAVGFGKHGKPAQASTTPPASSFNPATTPPAQTTGAPQPATTTPAAAPTATPEPHPGIMNPPASAPAAPSPAAPVRQMTEKANGLSYEAYIQSGWNDEQLIQHGMMVA